MSDKKQYTWDDLKADEAKSKDGLLMLIHGKGPSLAPPWFLLCLSVPPS